MRATTVILVLAISGFAAHAQEEVTPHSIIDRALKAGGGVDKIRSFKAVSFRATLTSGDVKVRINGLFAAHNLYRMDLNTDEASYVAIGGGDTLWLKEGMEPFKEYHMASEKSGFESMNRTFYALGLPNQLLLLKGKDFELKIVGNHAVNGVQTVGIKATHELHPEALIFFDKDSGLPVKTQVKLPASKGIENLFAKRDAENLEVFFDDYQEFDGVKHFTRVKLRAGDDIYEGVLRDVKLQTKVDAGAFKKPKS